LTCGIRKEDSEWLTVTVLWLPYILVTVCTDSDGEDSSLIQ